MLFSTVAVLISLPSNRTCESFCLPTSPTLFLIFLNNGCANQLPVAVTHNNQCKRKRHLFWLIVSEVALDLPVTKQDSMVGSSRGQGLCSLGWPESRERKRLGSQYQFQDKFPVAFFLWAHLLALISSQQAIAWH